MYIHNTTTIYNDKTNTNNDDNSDNDNRSARFRFGFDVLPSSWISKPTLSERH